MRPHAVLIDLDGTLVDSNEAHIDAWRIAFHDLGYDIDGERIRPEVGKGGDQLVPAILGEEGEREHGDALRKGHDAAFERLARKTHLEVFPGAVQLLETLHRRWMTTAIATSSKKKMVDLTMESIGTDLTKRVDLIVTPTDGARSKPAPDLLVTTLHKVSLPPEQCIFIGDTVHDAEAARRAGIPFIGVLCGGCASETDLALGGAVSVWHDPADILQHLDQVLATADYAGAS